VNVETGSKKRLGLRISAFLLGILVLIWLPIEDQNVLLVVLISGGICTWAAAWILVKPVEGNRQIILRHGLVGMGAGLAVAPLGIMLMALKSGIHGHGTPDFTVAQLQEVMSRLPFFTISGLLIGLGSGLYRIVRRDSQTEEG
jgi:hypothetical protein